MIEPITRQQLPDAVKNAKNGATLLVANETVKELALQIIAPDRMNRPDLRIMVAGVKK